MSNWNDLTFEEKCVRLSEYLRAALNLAIDEAYPNGESAIVIRLDDGCSFDDLSKLASLFGTRDINLDTDCNFSCSHHAEVRVSNIATWPEALVGPAVQS